MLLHLPRSNSYVVALCGARGITRVTYGKGKATCPKCIMLVLAGDTPASLREES